MKKIPVQKLYVRVMVELIFGSTGGRQDWKKNALDIDYPQDKEPLLDSECWGLTESCLSQQSTYKIKCA